MVVVVVVLEEGEEGKSRMIVENFVVKSAKTFSYTRKKIRNES